MTSKLIIPDVSLSTDIEDIRLIFESPRYCGKCSNGYEIIDIKEHKINDQFKLIVLEYSDIESVRCILMNDKIIYRNQSFSPIAFNQDLLNQYLTVEKLKKVEEVKTIENRSYVHNFDLVEETDTAYLFKFSLIKHKYPYYLLEYNQNVLKDLKNELKSLFSAFISEDINDFYLIKAEFAKTKLSINNISSEYNIWSYHLNHFLNQYVNRCFFQYTLPINDRKLFVYMRDKTIKYYSKSDSIALIYKNDLNDYWIRIEGDAKLMETEKKKIEKDIFIFNKNSSIML